MQAGQGGMGPVMVLSKCLMVDFASRIAGKMIFLLAKVLLLQLILLLIDSAVSHAFVTVLLYFIDSKTQRQTGRQAQLSNIGAARAVADIIRTTLGPRSMLKVSLSLAVFTVVIGTVDPFFFWQPISMFLLSITTDKFTFSINSTATPMTHLLSPLILDAPRSHGRNCHYQRRSLHPSRSRRIPPYRQKYDGIVACTRRRSR